MKTYSPKPNEVERKWYVVDGTGKTLGRMATAIARKLSGKDKPEYARHVDTGDFVVVINADKIKLTGNKTEQKKYYRHSGYPGGIKETPFTVMLDKKPEYVIKHAVKGMLPKNRLGTQQLKKLKVYTGGDHPHEAQQPQPLQI
ncbi:MAG: 50S ribosomal protein L13 [Desulfonatronovibrionaceae bacterium]